MEPLRILLLGIDIDKLEAKEVNLYIKNTSRLPAKNKKNTSRYMYSNDELKHFIF
jgi:hypothetical protein